MYVHTTFITKNQEEIKLTAQLIGLSKSNLSKNKIFILARGLFLSDSEEGTLIIPRFIVVYPSKEDEPRLFSEDNSYPVTSISFSEKFIYGS